MRRDNPPRTINRPILLFRVDGFQHGSGLFFDILPIGLVLDYISLGGLLVEKRRESSLYIRDPGLTEDFRAAGKTWEEAWRGISAKIRSELGGKKLGGSFYEELEDYVRSVYESEKEISDIQRRFSPFFNKEAAE